jgi:dTDP-4-dehydrorhamnose 3,5-epimerase
MTLNILETPINGLKIIESSPHVDLRGAFNRFYCQKELMNVIGERIIVQINHSRTERIGAVRGLHFQYLPYAEMKLVRCLKGRVWDVAVDLRANSPTFLKWYAVELSPTNGRMLLIPEGFAHGFQVMEPESELLYLHTEFFAPKAEGGLRYDDPKVDIIWPLAITELSKRDTDLPFIDSDFQGLLL